jgi:hypothetical protein
MTPTATTTPTTTTPATTTPATTTFTAEPLDRDGASVRVAHQASRPLRSILRANAAFSLACGAVALIAADRLAEWIGADGGWIVRLVGVALVVYCPMLLATAASCPERLRTFGVVVSIADLVWVAGTIALLASGAVDPAGAWVLGITGLVVLVFGVEQLIARRPLARTLDRTVTSVRTCAVP